MEDHTVTHISGSSYFQIILLSINSTSNYNKICANKLTYVCCKGLQAITNSYNKLLGRCGGLHCLPHCNFIFVCGRTRCCSARRTWDSWAQCSTVVTGMHSRHSLWQHCIRLCYLQSEIHTAKEEGHIWADICSAALAHLQHMTKCMM